ncbi:transporter [Lithospermum erythrorhizon]|uniref:Transporter n=1 Tax=Lithospermum erythrorhizon TaxID=34254 RepID=A0AAV3PDT2_LITER
MDQESPPKRSTMHKGGILMKPISWLRMLSDELHWSFVLSVTIVYGINQGLSFGLSRIGTQYYMKDEQKLQPSEAQFYTSFIAIPWIIKPLWGLLTDIVPIFGYRRRPYFILAGLVGMVSMLSVSLQSSLQLVFALLLLVTGSAAAAVGDVTIDACVTENSIAHPSLAGDMQSLCGFSASVGQLLGFIISGFLVHHIGPKGVFGVMGIPYCLVIVVGLMLKENLTRNLDYRHVNQKFLDAVKAMWMALKRPDVWRPCLYMYLSLAVSFHVQEGLFYWCTDSKSGPAFSQEMVGSISSVGAIGSLCGVLLYQNVFRNYPFRQVLFWTQLLFGASGLLDLMFVWRINLIFNIPDFVVAVSDAAISHMIARLKWMPLLVLSSKLCPSGIEGTFFALIMAIDHIGFLTASWTGGFMLHALNVTRTEFDNLWLAIVIRSLARILPVGLLFLVPDIDSTSSILPAEMLQSKKSDHRLEMASLVKGYDQDLTDE